MFILDSNATAILLLPKVLTGLSEAGNASAAAIGRHASRLDDLPLGIFYLVRRMDIPAVAGRSIYSCLPGRLS
jgi:hypothetical protein